MERRAFLRGLLLAPLTVPVAAKAMAAAPSRLAIGGVDIADIVEPAPSKPFRIVSSRALISDGTLTVEDIGKPFTNVNVVETDDEIVMTYTMHR